MADTFSHTSKPQRQDSSDHSNPGKFSYTYLYKAALVTVFLLLLPFFPSQPPEFINQTLHARSWELLQLIFVGIAVSYGLFSKKNDETDKDHASKFDNAQTYVSKLLQVSSVFDDETENQTVVDENKVQTWNSQYYRGEPLKVVAKESPISVKEEQTATSSGAGQKPLLLPVRSLKQRVPETDDVDDSIGKTGSLISRSRSNSGSKRFTSSSSKKSRNEELGVGEISPVNLEEKVEDNVVLRSPIPWRSRSGRIQMKENGDDLPSYSMEDPEFSSLESPSLRSSRPNSTCSTPKTVSPSPSISSPKKLSSLSSTESQAKSREDLMMRNNSHKFSPPPPPPPPPPRAPPTHLRKSVLMKSNSSVLNDAVCSEKQMRRSIRSMPTQELSETELDKPPRRGNFGSDFKAARVGSDDVSFVGKSVRKIRRGEFQTEKNPQQYEAAIFLDRSEGYTNKSMHETVIPNNASSKKEPANEKVILETSDDDDNSSETEFEDDYLEGSSSGNHGETTSTNANDGGNDAGRDVDKKADEFIAKFREQIRLQRIESIRRSTKQRAAANTSR